MPNMTAKVYLRPLGLLYGKAAAAAIETGIALPLAGGPIAFTCVEIIEGEPGAATRAIARLPTIQAIDEPVVKDILARLSAPRPPIAGLSFDRPRIMGIVNVTPDSFSDGGDHSTAESAAAHAQRLKAEGADLLDIGGESTRPGAELVPAEEEAARLLPVIEAAKGLGLPLSADSRKPEVMRRAAEAGADLLNDVSGLTYAPESAATAAATGLPVIIMHAQGDPKTMQINPAYRDVVMEVYDFLEARINAAVAAGIARERLIADPGIGFGKTLTHNLELLEAMSLFHGLGVPLLIGASRKGLVSELSGERQPKERLPGSLAAGLSAIGQGVQILRVHDVSATCQAISVWLSAQFGREFPERTRASREPS
jgi:dihydropteroate synthase